jgi:hypothetical protein
MKGWYAWKGVCSDIVRCTDEVEEDDMGHGHGMNVGTPIEVLRLHGHQSGWDMVVMW